MIPKQIHFNPQQKTITFWANTLNKPASEILVMPDEKKMYGYYDNALTALAVAHNLLSDTEIIKITVKNISIRSKISNSVFGFLSN